MGGRGETGRRSRLKIGFPWSAGSSPAVRTIALSLSLLASAGCDRSSDSGHVVVSAIGSAPVLLDPDRQPLATPTRLLTDSLAQGLVRFDAGGQIEPGLAERWIVIDDGRTYIFRLREAIWADGRPVTADEVVALLRRHLAPGSRNALAPFLTAIDSIVVMTPQVIEIRLKRPRPDLLTLFAQPEMTLLRSRPPAGSGPFLIATRGSAPLLRPAPDAADAAPDDPGPPRPERDVQLIGERAALAIARFAAGRADLVAGGTADDWPLLAPASLPPAVIRVDPAVGLFGLAVVSRDGFLADAAHRNAVAAAIDRAAIADAVRPGWTTTETILPDQLDSASAPAVPAWSALPLDARRQAAAALVRGWGEPVRLRLALPAGPGGTLLWGQLAASLAAIGIAAERVAPAAPADLRLVDMVAPYDSARWYLATACVLCGPEGTQALSDARDAPTLTERARLIAAADVAVLNDAAFIPLARPLRWSLVSPRLARWTPNARAWHPLNRLRIDTTS